MPNQIMRIIFIFVNVVTFFIDLFARKLLFRPKTVLQYSTTTFTTQAHDSLSFPLHFK